MSWVIQAGMIPFIILGLLFLPIVEIYTIIRVAEFWGGWPTFILILITGFAGVALAKSQGRRVFREVQEKAALGQAPARKMIEGLLVFLGGVLLLFPGFVSDILALFIVLPVLRPWLASRILVRFEKKARAGTIRFFSMGPTGFRSTQPWGFENQPKSTDQRDVIDVDARNIGNAPLPPPGNEREKPPTDH